VVQKFGSLLRMKALHMPPLCRGITPAFLTATQQAGWMKTRINLPSDLVRAIKLRALNGNRRLKEVVTDLLRSGFNGFVGGARLET
jgi:hypothetical protein